MKFTPDCASRRKIKEIEEMKKIVEADKKSGKKVIFTNGCFDIIHTGHVRYLYRAASMGDVLIVGLNSDSSVKSYKTPDRPINDQDQRAEVLAALEMVDYVVIFAERTPQRLILDLKPDVQVKGGDYKIEDIPEAKAVQSYGGGVVIVPLIKGRSTTGVIEKIRNSLKKELSKKED